MLYGRTVSVDDFDSERERAGYYGQQRSDLVANLPRPVGRVLGPAHLEAVNVGDRVALLYSRHDLGGAWARDNLGTWEHAVVPGGDPQREHAIRLGVNIVMYALCLDYKDDQVHAPFIMRRRGGRGP